MKIYYYDIQKFHKKKDTDKYIIESVTDYAKSVNKKCLIDVKRTIHGKPFIPNSGIYVGVTHTKKLLVIAVDNVNLGIDAEDKTRVVKRAKSIAEKYFTPDEKEYVYDGDEIISERFIEIWVKKEAYLKFLGIGLADIKEADVFHLVGTFEKHEKDNILIYIYNEKTLND